MNDQTILIVDDEAPIRLTLCQAMEDIGFAAEAAETGEEALQRLREHDFALVLLDYQLPGINGMDVLREARALRPALPVVIITAHGDIQLAVEAMRTGATNFLTKPFAPHEVQETVREACERRRMAGLPPHIVVGDQHLAAAREALAAGDADTALQHAHAAMCYDDDRAEPYAAMGDAMRLKGLRSEAQKYYRLALQIDATLAAARDGLAAVQNG